MKYHFTALLFTILLAGCTAGATGTLQPTGNGEDFESHIEYHSLQIQGRLEIADIRQRYQGDLLQVSVDLRNRTERTLNFQYKFKFYDKDGFEVGTDSRPWAPITISGNELSSVQGMAPNPSATRFRIIVRN